MNLLSDLPIIFNINNPEFEKADRVCDWRNYVSSEWQKHWLQFTERERQIIAIMAQMRADNEEWINILKLQTQ